MPRPRPKRPHFVPDLDLPADPASLEAGALAYRQYCGSCHGARGGSEGAMPNLQRSTAITHRNFERIVLEGSREEEGMPAFDGLLTSDEVRRIQAYIVEGARASIAEAEAEAASPDSHN